MVRYLVLLNFTENGLGNISKSPDRAAKFKGEAEAVGVIVECLLWTLGPHDGALVIQAPDDETAVAQILNLGSRLNVTTTMMRAFDAGEFSAVVSKL
ncbi:MAG: GYD domain-containing protein [Planctomycetaceae bacterium]|nr:GYD domain-containing protein [Planctomycetaceae bacterium]